ncbi:MAG: M28 family peptidase [Candidatus Lokiarchaeota archaeon]|nr:M28 family peptidase [Candidatus Lokiarchaeota archaeon]
MTENSRERKTFDKDRLFNLVKIFSFPRLSGTDGEEKSVKLCVKEFKNIGFKEEDLEQEKFVFSDFYSTTLIQLVMIISLTSYLILLYLAYIYPIVILFVFGVIAIVIILIIKGLRTPEKGFWGEYFGTSHSSTNVIAKIPALENPSKNCGHLIISAHLDSKSQSFKTGWRIVLYRLFLFGGIILGILYLVQLFSGIFIGHLGRFSIFFQLSIWACTFVLFLSNVMLLFLTTGNKSPGALDNASGMSIVFELARYFKMYPLNNLNLWFCQFSAEELGTMGSRIFVNNREHLFLKGKTFQINLDMISSAKHGKKKNRVQYLKSYGIFPRKVISPLLGRYLDQAAAKEGLEIHGFHLSTGAHLDSVPFHLRGYDAIDIATRAAAKYTHNKIDTPDKVDPEVLLRTAKIVRRAVLTLDEDFV